MGLTVEQRDLHLDPAPGPERAPHRDRLGQVSRPQPGEVALVLRIEFKLKTSSGIQPMTVEGAQVWIQQGSDWRIAMTQRSDLAPSPTFRLPVPAKPNTTEEALK